MNLFDFIKTIKPWLEAKIYNDIMMVRLNNEFYHIKDISGAIRGGKGILILDVIKED